MTGLWISLAGAVGAVCRLMIDGVIRRRVGSGFPWSTFVINVSGSLLLGVVTGLILFHHDPPDLKLIIGAGFCGGYSTTFSTASFKSRPPPPAATVRCGLGQRRGHHHFIMAAAAVGLAAVRP